VQALLLTQFLVEIPTKFSTTPAKPHQQSTMLPKQRIEENSLPSIYFNSHKMNSYILNKSAVNLVLKMRYTKNYSVF
jgi:hypothetical protein